MRTSSLQLLVVALIAVPACSREMFCAPCPACAPPIVAAPVVPAPVPVQVIPEKKLASTPAPAARHPDKPAPEPAPPALVALSGGRVRNAKEYFATLDTRFRPDASKDLHAVFQFDSTGPNACAYHAHVDDGAMKLESGRADKADVTILASAEDYVKVVNGEMGGVGAVMDRKMKVSGNLSLARRMKKIFPPGHADKSSRADATVTSQ